MGAQVVVTVDEQLEIYSADEDSVSLHIPHEDAEVTVSVDSLLEAIRILGLT